jgi:MFS family permease
MPNPWRGLRGLPASLWLLFAATLINRAGTMVLPFLALYLRGQGFTVSQAGAFLALYGTVAIFASPLAGRLSDRFRPLPVMVAGLLANGLVLLAFPLARGPFLLLAVAGIAATNETVRPASMAAVTAWSAPSELRMAFALVRLAINLGVSVGPALGGFLATVSFRALFVIDAATSLAAGTVLLVAGVRMGLARQRPEAPEARAQDGSPRSPRSPYTDGRFLAFLGATFLVMLVFFQHNSTMPLYMRGLGLSPAVYGLMFTLNTLLIVALEVPLNGAMAAWPIPGSLALGAFFSGAGFGALALAGSAWQVAATVVVWTFGEMITFPAAAAYASHLAPADRQGAYMGAYSMTSAAAFAVGPWAGARLLAQGGGNLLWGSTFLCGVLAAALFWRLREEAGAGG